MKKSLASVVLSAAMVAGCGLSSAEEEDASAVPGIDAEANSVRIGSFVPETGPVPSFKLIADGSKAYFDSVNEAGGLCGYTFDYDQVDDAYDPARSLSATRGLVENGGVFALVAPIGTPTNAAVKDYAVEQELPVVGAISGDPELATLPNFFSLLPSYVDEARLVTTYAVEEEGAERVAVMYQNDDLGKPALKGAQEAMAALGKELVAEIPFNVSDTDLTAAVTLADQADADAVLVWGSNGNLATTVTTAERLGFDTQFYAPFYTADPSTYELAGDALHGTMFGSWLLPASSDESVADYREAMETYARTDDIGVFSLNGWTNAALFGQAFEEIACGDEEPTREALLAALEGFSKQAVGGAPEVTFTADNHNGTASLSILEAADGTFRTVTKPIPFAQ